MNLGHLWICLVGITPQQQPKCSKGNITLCGREFSSIALYGHWATPLVMEYNSRAWEYCLIIVVKDQS